MIIAGTGHRPPKLGGYCNRLRVEEFAVEFLHLHQDYIDCVISGGALGWDQAIAKAAQSLQIPYKMYLPFEGFDGKWPDESKDYLEWLCERAQEVEYISPPGYEPHKMYLRDEAMVIDCDLLVALYNGSGGGTGKTISYAKRWYKPHINLWSAWERFKKGELIIWPNLHP